MKHLLAGVAATVLGGSMVFLAAQGGSGVVSASAKAPSSATVAAARANFTKVMSSHAPEIGHGGWVSPGGLQRKTGSVALGSVVGTQSINWSGYADQETGSNTVSQVSGSWTIPSVTCLPRPYQNQDAFLANWVGIDGYNDQTVEQLGSATQCFEGVEYYYVWYEMYPAGTVEEGTTACIDNNIDCPQPGDQITASVTVTPGSEGENNYKLTLTDRTRPDESFSTTASCATSTCLDSSAEWIVERPAVQPPPPAPIQILPLADYYKTVFNSASLVSGGKLTSVGRFRHGSVNDIAMTDDTDSYYLDCVDQGAPPGTLLPVGQGNECPTESPFPNGGFGAAWDSSF